MRYIKFNKLMSTVSDDYYVMLDPEDNTWGSVLDVIESQLDEMYCENEDELTGIKLKIEIVGSIPDGVEFDN